MPRGPSDATDDTYQALLLAWGRSNFLSSTFPEPIRAGRLRSREGAQSPAPPGVFPPYAHMLVEKGRSNERNTGLSFRDYRNVTITLVGTKAQVSPALVAVAQVFNKNLLPSDLAYVANLPPDQTNFVQYYTLTYPYYSGRKFLRWWPMDDNQLVEDETTARGKDVWRGILKGEITSVLQD